MNKEEFIKELEKINISLNKEQLENLNKYYELLVSYNKKVNLTAITKEEDVYLKHFYDSLTLSLAIDLTTDLSICDIGTGAGFPGLVLKICFPNLKITLVDSLEKRINFLNLVIETLNLKQIEAIHSRIEELEHIEKYDLVVSRAVAKTNVLLELGCRLPKIKGFFILMKGNVLEELNTSKNAIQELGYSIHKSISFQLPIEKSERTLLVLRKEKSTSDKYPREFSKIKKMPL